MKFLNNKNIIILLISVLAAVLLFVISSFVVAPKRLEAEVLLQTNQHLEKEITKLGGTIEEVTDDKESATSEFKLRKSLPDNRAISELILNLEEIEYDTKSKIKSIKFSDYDSSVSDTMAEKEEKEPVKKAGEEEVKKTDAVAEKLEEPVIDSSFKSKIPASSLPTDLKMITLQLIVEFENNTIVPNFLAGVENLNRVIYLDSIKYSVPGEELVFGEVSERVEAAIQITTFYSEE